jgi:hypothetical protein
MLETVGLLGTGLGQPVFMAIKQAGSFSLGGNGCVLR